MAAKIPKLLWLFILALLMSGCDRQIIIPDILIETEKPASEAEQAAPVAIVALEGKTLKFECLDAREDCPRGFDVTDFALLDWPYHLASVYYCNPSSIFILLYADAKVPWERSVIHYNPQTQDVKFVKLPRELDISSSTTAGGRLVLLGDQNGPVYILDEKLSIRKIEVGSSFNILISGNNQEIIVLNEQPVEENGELFIHAYLIDAVSGQLEKKILCFHGLQLIPSQSTLQAGLKYLIIIEGISRDLNSLYGLYFDGDAPNTIKLGVFEIRNSRELVSTQDPNLVKMVSGYAQYHEFLYANSTLIDMSTLSSLLDFDEYPELKKAKIIALVPFGDFFLLNLVNYAVFRLSPDGKVLDEYILPAEWRDKDYRVMIYWK